MQPMAERTLIILKPDALQRHLAGRIVERFERKGFRLAAAKLLWISQEQARRHYAVHEGKPFFEGVVKYLASGPSLVMVWEGPRVIEVSRKMMGKTFGFDAEPGTIRGDFGLSQRFNLIHGSDSSESAAYEIGLYFKDDELVDYDFSDGRWIEGMTD